ncbi:MAG: phosphoribosyltransferase [Firmicutes bacterium]|nr:phosphoribosyltransferase [Bacillota bacterium]
MRFVNREDAGDALATWLIASQRSFQAVVAIPRGGVVVAGAVARRCQLPLYLAPVRKLGHPEEPEFALGALAPEGILVWHRDRQRWASPRLTAALAQEVERARESLEAWLAEPSHQPWLPPAAAWEGVAAVVVDDGLATGLTLLAALRWLRCRTGARRLLGLVPVASEEALTWLREQGEEVVSLRHLGAFGAVGEAYQDFHPVSDAEVDDVLRRHQALDR